VQRDNLYIKIPATQPGLTAITEVISEGISVNVTLIFSLDRYRRRRAGPSAARRRLVIADSGPAPQSART
jgi:transaldolase